MLFALLTTIFVLNAQRRPSRRARCLVLVLADLHLFRQQAKTHQDRIETEAKSKNLLVVFNGSEIAQHSIALGVDESDDARTVLHIAQHGCRLTRSVHCFHTVQHMHTSIYLRL